MSRSLSLHRRPPQLCGLRLPPTLAVLAALAILALTSGCIAVLAGAGAGATVAYVRGDLDTTLDRNLDRSARATRKTIEQLEYVLVSHQQDALQAVFAARNASDQKLEIYLEKASDDSTKLKIRLGTFGNEALQNEILAKLKSNL